MEIFHLIFYFFLKKIRSKFLHQDARNKLKTSLCDALKYLSNIPNYAIKDFS